MIERYSLNLHSSKYDVSGMKKLNNKYLKQRLISIRNAFRNNSSVVLCKKNIESVIQTIIPTDFFGSKRNQKLFLSLVRKILNHRKGEYLHISLLTKNFEQTFELMMFMQNENEFEEILRNIIFYLLEKCIKPFIKRHFFPVSQGKSYRIDLIPKSKWQSFRDKIFHQMISEGHIELSRLYVDKVPRGALRILPRQNCDTLNYRPVICYYSKTETEENYKYICQIKNKLRKYVAENKLHYDIHESWEDFVSKSGFESIYGVKADVEDSFGNISIDDLTKVIEELPKEILSDSEKYFVISRVTEQYISFNNVKNRIIIRWCHGLLQGDRLSSILCDLYYLVLIDLKLLKDCLVGHFFFHRTVDDYIFCSTIKGNVETFISKLTQGHILNQDKIFSNVLEYRHLELPYCGYMFNLYTKEVFIGINMKNVDLRCKLKLWNDDLFTSPDKYLTNIMKFSSSNFHFNKVIFNTHYNHEETIVKIYFHSMIYVGMKFHCSFSELRQYHVEYCRNSYIITKKIIEIINKYVRKSIRALEYSKGTLFFGDIKPEMLLTIGVRAFILVFQKYFEIYKDIIAFLKKKVFMKIAFFRGLDISFFNKIPSDMIVE